MWTTLTAILATSLPFSLLCDDANPQGTVVKEPELRRELIRRVEVDQEARGELIALMKKDGGSNATDDVEAVKARKAAFEKLAEAVNAADRENTKRLGEIVAAHGWPTISRVGKDGAHAAWLLVQHADAEPGFQRTCLDLMTQLPKAETLPDDVAYLTDRVLLAEGKKQVYGTQFTNRGGKWEPRPLEDPANVDRRRAEVGLAPLAEYARQLESVYGKAQGR